MFTTLVPIYQDLPGQADRDAAAHPEAVRPKRTQVARACSWCRLNRVRCDNHHPCRNCRNRDGRCNRGERDEATTLPTAKKQIEALRLQISQLKRQLMDERSSSRNLSLRTSQLQPLSGALAPAMQSRRGFLATGPTREVSQLYGLSSLQCLLSRMSSFLRSTYGWPYYDHNIQPNTPSLTVTRPTNLAITAIAGSPASLGDLGDGVYMTRAQEEECLGLFWQTYHCAVPILDELEFNEYHASLWANHIATGTCRNESPLVDMVLAICIQYGMTFVPRESAFTDRGADVNMADPSHAGGWYFQRSQSLLKLHLESPSVMLLQCQILSVIYLRDSSYVNMASSVAAAAVQTVYALGFHLEIGGDFSRKDREHFKRLWCMVYALESKMSMDLGRSFLTRELDVRLPCDDTELASISSPMFTVSSALKITWLTYHKQHVKLVKAARDICLAFEEIRAHALSTNGGKGFYEDTHALNRCGAFLTQKLSILSSWLHAVPESLKCRRRSPGVPFATDGSLLQIDQSAPVWLQMQQFTLELLYHDIVISLCRPFICFEHPSTPSTTVPDSNAIVCLKHAITVTDIIHQVLQETITLCGWHRAYQFQWDATLSMIAFAFAYPNFELIPSTRRGIEKAISVFDMFDRNFAVAARVGRITRDLYQRINYLSTIPGARSTQFPRS